ncbi:MAG: ParB/RepB/Spo0J family partition protein, partial [Gammaproteobacteria bacterium]
MELTPIEPNQVAMIPLSQIEPDPEQPRKSFNQESLQQLADDIKANGIQQPITIRKPAIDGDPYVIKYGERRYLASKLANKRVAPCILAQPEKGERPKVARIFAQAKENHLRDELNPMDWALTFRQLRESGMQVKEIAEACAEHGLPHMSRPHISNLMRLAELPDWAQQLIVDKRISAAHGKYLFAALVSEDVTALVREQLEDKDDDPPSVRELQSLIVDAFREKHRRAYELDWPGHEELSGQKKALGIVEVPDGEGGTHCFALDVERYEAALTEHRQSSFELNGEDDDAEDDVEDAEEDESENQSQQAAPEDPYRSRFGQGQGNGYRAELSVHAYLGQALLAAYTSWDLQRLALWKACDFTADPEGPWANEAIYECTLEADDIESAVGADGARAGWPPFRSLTQVELEECLASVGAAIVPGLPTDLLARLAIDADVGLDAYRIDAYYCESCAVAEIEVMVRQVHEAEIGRA